MTITGVSENRFQIPNNPGQPVNNGGFAGAGGGPYSAFGFTDFNSANINQNQYEKNAYAVAAWQRHVDDIDMQLAYYSRYSDLHFVPDPIGDLVINNVASDVFRSTFLNGISGDFAWRIDDRHIARTGFFTNAEYTQIRNLKARCSRSTPSATPIDTPVNILDSSNKLGYQLGAYVQDEFRITDKLTANYGLRFDQMYQYVDANQLSPRASLTYKPLWGTTLHAGYARYYTPPEHVLGRTVPNGLFDNTTAAAPSLNVGAIHTERSNVCLRRRRIVQDALTRRGSRRPRTCRSRLKWRLKAARACSSASTPTTRRPRTCSKTASSGRPMCSHRLQLRRRRQLRHRVDHAYYREGNFAFDMELGLCEAEGHHGRVEPEPVHAWDDLAFLASHWVYTDHDQRWTGFGARRLPLRLRAGGWLDRDDAERDRHLRQRPAQRRRQCRPAAGVLSRSANLGASHEFVPPAGVVHQ